MKHARRRPSDNGKMFSVATLAMLVGAIIGTTVNLLAEVAR